MVEDLKMSRFCSKETFLFLILFFSGELRFDSSLTWLVIIESSLSLTLRSAHTADPIDCAKIPSANVNNLTHSLARSLPRHHTPDVQGEPRGDRFCVISSHHHITSRVRAHAKVIFTESKMKGSRNQAMKSSLSR